MKKQSSKRFLSVFPANCIVKRRISNLGNPIPLVLHQGKVEAVQIIVGSSFILFEFYQVPVRIQQVLVRIQQVLVRIQQVLVRIQQVPVRIQQVLIRIRQVLVRIQQVPIRVQQVLIIVREIPRCFLYKCLIIN